MKAWIMVFLLFVSGSCLVANGSLNAAQGSGEELRIENNLIRVSYRGNEEQQRYAQAEQPKPERPIRQIRPGILPALKNHAQPTPSAPEPWYKNSTILVALISAISAISVALIGLLKRK